MKPARILILLLSLAGSLGLPTLALAVSKDNPYHDIILNKEPELDYDDSLVKKWEEDKINSLPELYDTDDLQEASINEVQKGFTVLVDKKHLSIGDDGVLRYWLVLRSGQGAVNAMYEGMRCETSEYKTYAFVIGRKHRRVAPMRDPRWQKVRGAYGPNFRWELMQDYFCMLGRAKPVEQILDNLRVGPAIGIDKTDDDGFF